MTDKRVALVTGGSRGIGAATARRLARDGYKVALHSRRSADVVKHHGRLDVLVNNAGESPRIPHADLKAATPAIWRRLLDINLIAPFLLITEAEAALRKSGETGRPACIVNIGTHAGTRPKGASIPYAAAKAGLHHVTRLLALSLGPAIRVNCVAPGLVETPMTAGWPEATELWNTRSPMRRPAKPEDIADLVAALAANDYVTGEVVIADGGLNLT